MVPLLWIISLFVIGIRAEESHGFKSHRRTLLTYENSSVFLPCYADDLGVKTRVKWWKDSTTVLVDSEEPESNPEKIRLWPNRTLQVSNLQRKDKGSYVCQVSRPKPWGHITQVYEIEVMYPPSVHPIPESGKLEVNLGEGVDMGCVSEGVPIPILTWKTKDGDKPLWTEKSRLRFPADNRDLAGLYTCTASNDVGEPASATIELLIRYKPEIEARKAWVHASPGIRVQLDCSVTAWPQAQVEWFFKDARVNVSSRIVEYKSGDNHSLVIRNVRSIDYGDYLCRATNALGINEAIIELSGVANPAVFKESHSISKTAHNFIWEVDSYVPIIEYEFCFRKRPIYNVYRRLYGQGTRNEWHTVFIPSGGDSNGPVQVRSYNLTGLTEATHYEAHVYSRNRYGRSRPSKILRFSTEGAPNIDEDYKGSGIPEDKILPAVQLASMSQHYPSDTNTTGSSSVPEIFVLLILSPAYIAIQNFV